jgi:integrase
MASVFKRSRWVDAAGRKCVKGTPGAKRVVSRIWMIRIQLDGRPKLVKGFTDKGATEQLASDLEKKKARGEVGLIDPYKVHRARALADHVADYVADLRAMGKDSMYTYNVEKRLAKLLKLCGWNKLGDITADAFSTWREKPIEQRQADSETGTIGPRTINQYFETLRAFCNWCVKRKRIASNPVTDVEKVDQTTDVRRQRRALTEDEVTALLAVVPSIHQLPYRMILSTGLRRDELKQLQWGDVKMNAPMPHIQLRAETTKAIVATPATMKG